MTMKLTIDAKKAEINIEGNLKEVTELFYKINSIIEVDNIVSNREEYDEE